MGLSPLTRIVTNLERHLLSLSNRDFAARTHATGADLFEDAVVGESVTDHVGSSEYATAAILMEADTGRKGAVASLVFSVSGSGGRGMRSLSRDSGVVPR